MKKYLLLFTVAISASHLFGEVVDTIVAKEIASNFYHSNASRNKQQRVRAIAQKQVEFNLVYQEFDSILGTEIIEPYYYVYNVGSNNGFVIVSADDTMEPILAYSFDGKFEIDKIPSPFSEWLNVYKVQIRHLKKQDLVQTESIKSKWGKILIKASHDNNVENPNAVPPLLDGDGIKWGQGCYYNIQFPDLPCPSNCGKAPVGCMAVAMGQIMRYWKHPIGNYHWDNMPPQLTNQNISAEMEEISHFLYDVALSINTDFNCDGSSANINNALLSFINDFNYSDTANIIERETYDNDIKWLADIKSNLESGCPVLYTGTRKDIEKNEFIGHAFVCDGYDENDMLHFNWGWDGQMNAYVYFSSLDEIIPNYDNGVPSGINFNLYQKAIIDLIPALPDLHIVDCKTDLYSIKPGEFFNTSCVVSNSGGSAGVHHVSVYLAKDVKHSKEDVFLGFIPMSGIPSKTCVNSITKAFQIPNNTIPGEYYILFHVDGSNIINESNEENNFASVQLIVRSDKVLEVEYFIDNDPGFGNGIPLNITQEKVFEGKFNIPLSNCSEGFHVFFVRAKDSDNKWSITQSAPFYKLKNTAQHVSYLEYFIDADPGFGLGTKLATNAPGTISEYYNIPLASIKDGFHVLYIRAKDNNGIWSLCGSNSFYKIGTRSVDIIKMEFFIDVDPGFNNAIPISITKGKSIQKVININLSEISNGLHTFFVRAQDASGSWSITHQSAFYKTSSKLRNISALEYFFNMDPGYGYGTVIPVNHASPDITKHINIELACLTSGQHTFYIRARDEVGRWSLIHSKAVDVIITAPVITQSGGTLHSNASRGNQWYNQNGLIEGATDQVYIPTETGEYYIVVTQSNCSSEKSNIITVFYSGNKQLSSEQFVEIHPNPASESIHIKGISSYANISFFDISGKQVLNSVVTSETVIHIDNLPRGWYIINIQTETGTKKIKLIKK